jgi:hypothetical protein
MGKEFCDLHQLMLREGFPQTPKDFYQAKTFLDECLCYGKFDDKGHIIAAFIVGELTQESAFLDVVCCQEKRGRWLSFGLMRRIMQFLFHDLGLHYVWVQPQIKESYKLAIDMGFQLVHNQHTENGLCLILTKQKYLSSKFNK